MFQWPAKCDACGNAIDDWAGAGLYDGKWLHKRCWSERHRESAGAGTEAPPLRSPLDRSSQLELPMMISLLLFHFGLAAAVAGWFILTQTKESETAGIVLLVVGLIVPLLGAAGAALNIVSRRHIELIRHELDLQGGWKPGW